MFIYQNHKLKFHYIPDNYLHSDVNNLTVDVFH